MHGDLPAKLNWKKYLFFKKKAVRAMTGNRWYQTHSEPGPLAYSNPLFKHLSILKVEDVYKLNVAKFIFSCLSHLTPPLFWNWFVINNNDRATRLNTTITQSDYFDVGSVTQHLTLHRQSCKKDSYGAKKVQVLGPVIWNDLPGELRDAPSLQIFKKSLISLLLSNYSLNQ